MTVNLKVAVLFVREDTEREINSVLSHIEDIEISALAPAQRGQLSEAMGAEAPDIVIVEINGHHEDDLQYIEAMLKHYGERVTVFATAGKADMQTMHRLLRAGVKDFFPQPIQTQELMLEVTEALSAKRARIKQAETPGHVVAFLNAKGGSGATTLALNVAQALALKPDSSVALIDLDVQFGIIAMCLDLQPRSTVVDALKQSQRVDSVFLRALMTQARSGLHVLASPGDLSSVEDISAEAVRRIVQVAAADYEYVFLDIPRVFNSWTLAALRLADPIMLVVQNSLATIRDARLMLEQLPRVGIPTNKIELINNRAMAELNSVPIDALKETLKKTKIHRVRNDYGTAVRAQDEGVPVVELAKRSDLAKDLQALANYIEAMRRGESGQVRPGVLGRLFGRRG
jgi:pilus assembly protein CpaE